jgi:hypothetical protein
MAMAVNMAYVPKLESGTKVLKMTPENETLQNDLFEDEIKKLKYIETLANQQDRCCIFISG